MVRAWPCSACLLRPVVLRELHPLLGRQFLSTSSSTPSSTTDLPTPLQTAQARFHALLSQARALSTSQFSQLSQLAAQINTATGYDTIDRLRLDVMRKEAALQAARANAANHKAEYAAAATARANSQKEVNDLLQRKSAWTQADVTRFTELVQQDHGNERAEAEAKAVMDRYEEDVDKGFSELMQGILERYHEEQVWSDKIRSLSTYGTLAITGLNVLLFVVTILLVEPWKRKRLVEGVEDRIRETLAANQSLTLAAIGDLKSRLDAFPPSAPPIPPPAPPAPPAPAVVEPSAPPGPAVGEFEKERWIAGAAGAGIGVGVMLLVNALLRG